MPALKRTNSITDSPKFEASPTPRKNRRIVDQDDIEEEEEDQETRPKQNQLNTTAADFQDMSINLSGTIARVEVVNFMCHKYLKVDLGPKINFIIGHNGSGKSAILTAITLCLGANASATNRGKSVSSFIKEGTEAANITIHLTNGGPSAYRPDLYPGIIIVERKLLKDGGGQYKMKNRSNKLVSSKKEDLVAILDHFGILVNNPLTMLTQDMARKFLSDSTAEEKYRLFLRGTQLTQLREDFESIRESLDTSHVLLKRKEEGLPVLRNAAVEAQRKYADLEEATQLDDKIDVLNNELVWSQIIIKEKEAEELKGQVELAERNLTKTNDDYEQQKAKIDRCVKSIEEENDKLSAFKNLLVSFQDEKREINGERAALVAKNADFKDELQRINDIIRQTRTAKERVQAALKKETDKLEASTRVKRDEIVQTIENTKVRIEEKVKKAKGFNQDKRGLEAEIAAERETEHSMKNQLNAIKKKVEEKKSSVNQMEGQRGDRMRAFGVQMPRILEDIRRENGWKKRRPVGPLGSTIKLLKPEFAQTLEAVLNKLMNAFVVECFEDKNLLLQILRKNRMERGVSIMVSDYDIFDYSSGEPDDQYLTILRAIKFEDEWVKRQFIIFNKIEKTLLMENRAEADEVMHRNPRNIHLCFTSKGHKVGSSSGMKTESIDPYRGPPRFQHDVDGQIKKEHYEIQRLQEQFDETKQSLNEISVKIRDLDQRIRECRKMEIKLDQEIKGLEYLIDTEQEKLREEDPVNLDAFHNDIKEYEDKAKVLVQQFQDISAQRKPVQVELAEIDKKLKAIEQKVEVRDGVINEHQVKIDKLHGFKSKLIGTLDEFKNQRQTFKARYEQRKSAYNESRQLVKQWTEECIVDYPDRVETSRSPREIENDITALHQTVKSLEGELGLTVQEFSKHVQATVKAFDDANSVIKGMTRLGRSLSKMLGSRTEKWRQFRDFMSITAGHYFSFYLYERGDEGQLKFDHQAQKLEIRVSTGDQHRKGSRHKDSRSLSGGEKSFSQISLLLSLWQSISSPIICLDEFDVFMDAVNRRQTMGMIMAAASDNSSQYILITPQDASGMVPGKFVTIHRLADPERNHD